MATTGYILNQSDGSVTLAGTNITSVLDEDNMASDSATSLATQQSIKAYVDSLAGSPALPATMVLDRLWCGYQGTINVPLTTDDRNYLGLRAASSAIVNFFDMRSGGDVEQRDITADWATATQSMGMVKIGSYLYIGMYQTATAIKVYRYAANNLAAGGTEMTATFGANTTGLLMVSDGTYLYINNDGGDEASALHKFRKIGISGTTLSDEGTVTCGATTEYFTYAAVDSAGNFYGLSAAEDKIRRHDTGGTLQATTAISLGNVAWGFIQIEGTVFVGVLRGVEYFSLFKAPLQP